MLSLCKFWRSVQKAGLTSNCSLALLVSREHKAALTDAGADWWGWVNFPATQMWVTPSKAHWGSTLWHPRECAEWPQPWPGPCGCRGGHICARAVFYSSAQVGVAAQFTPCCWGWGACTWWSHGTCTMSLPRGDGAKVGLECFLVADLKIPSGSQITLDLSIQFGVDKWIHLEAGGQDAHQCQALLCKADMRDVGATLPFECFIMLFSWDHFNTAEFLSTYLESAVLLGNGFSGQFSIEVDCLHSQNITSGWVLVPVNGWGCLLLPAGSLQHVN